MEIHSSFNLEILKKYNIPLKKDPFIARDVEEFEKMYWEIHCKIRREMKKYSYKIVSLGTSCYTRFTLGRYGLKPFKFEGEESHPFDLAIHPISTIIHCIKSDFDKYLDLSYISQNKLWFYHNLYNISFVHEDDLNGNLKLFIERYEKRINNFRKLYLSKIPIFFIMFEDESNITYDEYKQLIDSLKLRFINYKFIYLTPTERKDLLYFNNVISFYRFCPLPDKYYKWQTSGCAETDLGIEFDLKNVEFCKNIIEKNFN